MALQLHPVHTRSTAQLSYLVGDDAQGTAAVVDPRPDVGVYLKLARRLGLSITHVFETHIHADFMSGARELADRCGGASVCLSVEGGAAYGFDHHGVRDRDAFTFGKTVLTARHTPGHTPEHLSFLLSEKDKPDDPWAVLSGDSLFVGSAGRPDLVDGPRGERLPDQLFETLTGFYLGLDDGVVVLPGHGSGSGCGADIGDRPLSAIGYERRHNPFLQHRDRDGFKRFVVSGATPVPTHYRRLKKLNAQGPPVLHGLPGCPALPAPAFNARIDDGAAELLDTRPVLSFGGGHIPGALHIANRPELSIWAGWMLDPERPVLLVVDDDTEVPRVLRRLARVGITSFAGYLAGGMSAWEAAGFALEPLPQWDVHRLRDQRDAVTVLDVRQDDEFEAGHVAGAEHTFVPELTDPGSLDALDRSKPIATFCGSGYRASIAASVLQRSGFSEVRNVIGSWKAWTAAGYAAAGESG